MTNKNLIDHTLSSIFGVVVGACIGVLGVLGVLGVVGAVGVVGVGAGVVGVVATAATAAVELKPLSYLGGVTAGAVSAFMLVSHFSSAEIPASYTIKTAEIVEIKGVSGRQLS